MPKMYYKRAIMSERSVKKGAEFILRSEYLEKKRQQEADQIKQEKPVQQIKCVVMGPAIVSFN